MKAKPGEAYEYLLAVLTTMPSDCTTWPFARNHGGYAELNLGPRKWRAHQLVCEWYHGPRPSPLHQVRHRCNNGHLGCFTPTHLTWGTTAEQGTDRAAAGRMPSGEQQHAHKLTTEQVAAIRSRYIGRGGPTQLSLAQEYGVSERTIHLIVRGRAWRNEAER